MKNRSIQSRTNSTRFNYKSINQTKKISLCVRKQKQKFTLKKKQRQHIHVFCWNSFFSKFYNTCFVLNISHLCINNRQKKPVCSNFLKIFSTKCISLEIGSDTWKKVIEVKKYEILQKNQWVLGNHSMLIKKNKQKRLKQN